MMDQVFMVEKRLEQQSRKLSEIEIILLENESGGKRRSLRRTLSGKEWLTRFARGFVRKAPKTTP